VNESPSASSPGSRNNSEYPRQDPGTATRILVTRLDRSAAIFIAIFYVVLTAVTRAPFQGDTPNYIVSILDYCGGRDFFFWDFGHLLWRPGMSVLLYVTHRIVPGANVLSLLSGLMVTVNWIAGLGCILLMGRIARKFVNAPLAVLAALTLAISQVFLNYVHTGTAYVPGFFFLLLALDLGTSKPPRVSTSWRQASVFGAALALAVLLWLPYIFAFPVLLLLPLLLHGPVRKSIRYTWQATMVCAVIGLGTYGAVAAKMRLSSLAEMRAWFNLASHSIDHIGGFPRAVFGFTRSWFEMGNDGIKFRRFLVHDPFVHIPAAALLFASLWKLMLTYLFLAAVGLKLVRGSGQDRRVFVFLLLAFLPVFAFGVKWQGGDMERYIAGFPALLLAGTCALSTRPATTLRILGICFVAALLSVNLSQDLRWVRDAQDRELSILLNELGSLPKNSHLFLFPNDPLLSFISTSAITPLEHRQPLVASAFITVGSSRVTQWRQIFASTSLNAWQNKAEVWICRGLLDPVPDSRWNWVEGAEPSVGWTDVHSFFSQLQTSDVRGDFVQLSPTQANIKLLGAIGSPTH
jgi:hypothetical protein